MTQAVPPISRPANFDATRKNEVHPHRANSTSKKQCSIKAVFDLKRMTTSPSERRFHIGKMRSDEFLIARFEQISKERPKYLRRIYSHNDIRKLSPEQQRSVIQKMYADKIGRSDNDRTQRRLSQLQKAITKRTHFRFVSDLNSHDLRAMTYIEMIHDGWVDDKHFPPRIGITGVLKKFRGKTCTQLDVLKMATSSISKTHYPRITHVISQELIEHGIKLDGCFCSKAIEIFQRSVAKDPRWFKQGHLLFKRCVSPSHSVYFWYFKLLETGLHYGGNFNGRLRPALISAMKNVHVDEFSVVFLEAIKAYEQAIRTDPEIVMDLLPLWEEIDQNLCADRKMFTSMFHILGEAIKYSFYDSTESINTIRSESIKSSIKQSREAFARDLAIFAGQIFQHCNYDEITLSAFVTMAGNYALFEPEIMDVLPTPCYEPASGNEKGDRLNALVVAYARAARADWKYCGLVVKHLTQLMALGGKEEVMSSMKAVKVLYELYPSFPPLLKNMVQTFDKPWAEFFHSAVQAFITSKLYDEATAAIDRAIVVNAYRELPTLTKKEISDELTLDFTPASFKDTDRLPKEVALALLFWWKERIILSQVERVRLLTCGVRRDSAVVNYLMDNIHLVFHHATIERDPEAVEELIISLSEKRK
ncbi:MAG: hypothetical protein ACPGUD_00365 [Parashewanella sp.]